MPVGAMLFFPREHEWAILELLNRIYQEYRGLSEIYNQDRIHFVLNTFQDFKLVSQDFAGNLLPQASDGFEVTTLPGMLFNIIEEDDTIILLYLKDQMQLDEFDPFLTLSMQFGRKYFFSLLEILTKDQSRQLFHVLYNFLKGIRDDDTQSVTSANSSISVIAESFSKKIEEEILELFRRRQGIQKARGVYRNSRDWSSRIDSVTRVIMNKVQNLSDDVKDSLDILYYSLHKMRALRNRTLHNSDFNIPIEVHHFLDLMNSVTLEFKHLRDLLRR